MWRIKLLIIVLILLAIRPQTLYAQKGLCPFEGVYNDSNERIQDLRVTIDSLLGKDNRQPLVEVIGNYETADKYLRMSTLFDNTSNASYILFEWMKGDQCRWLILNNNLEGQDWIGRVKEIVRLKDSTQNSYLIHFEKDQDGLLGHYIVNICLRPDTVFVKDLSLVEVRSSYESERSFMYWLDHNLEGENDSVYFIPNGFHYTKTSTASEGLMIQKSSSNYVYDGESFVEDIGSIEISFDPPIDSLPVEVLFRKNIRIGNEILKTRIERSSFVAGDYYAPEIYKRLTAIYEYKGQTISSSRYEGYDEEEDAENKEKDKQWGGFDQFKPDYVSLSDGSIVFRTYTVLNDFRSGMCGACDYLEENYTQIKGNKKYPLLHTYYNLGNGGGSYELYTENGQMPTIEFDSGDGSLYAGTYNLSPKPWKIIFDYQNSDSKIIQFYDLQIKPGPKKASIKLLKSKPLPLPH
ncbi:MAG: hypothetical protein CFE21_04980 [Bacteroidetes bacterium B1(2017)]|nr:MAG: hypothetical protein CFE21_04980 [Bacteroidetes bacterium B1(2017)]